jgi:UDP-N-acetyl-2-amino-2-deoxyglucuronate dehydrogenase
MATLRFADGALATITATTTAGPGFPPRLEIYGTAGCIQVEGESIRRWELVDPKKAPTEAPEITGIPTYAGVGGIPSGIAPIGIAPIGHAAVFRDFVEALHADHPPQVDGVEGRRSLATLTSIVRMRLHARQRRQQVGASIHYRGVRNIGQEEAVRTSWRGQDRDRS